jgi:hypothetical protein
MTYRNQALVADRILPRVPVDSPSFKHSRYTLADGFTIPDTLVGRKSGVNQIDWTATEATDSVQDFGLEDAIPNFDIMAAQAGMTTQGVNPVDPEARSAQLLEDLVQLDRENRVATLMTTLATYPAANRTTLSGTSQWSDFTNSDPVSAIMQALDVPVMRPNVLWFGQATWTRFRTHPRVTAAVFAMGGNATGGGTVVSREAVAALFELEEVVVGQSFLNTAKPGQTPSLSRTWGRHAGLIYRSPTLLSPLNNVTFGFTAQWGDKIAGTIMNDMSIGLRGGVKVRVGESVREVVCANDLAFFWQNAVA